jgi:DNA modification methylase
MKPYYEDVRAGIQIFLGDCRDILPTLSGVDLVLTDPPYGIKKAVWDSEVPVWAIGPLEQVLVEGGSLYWFGMPPLIYQVYVTTKLTFKRELYWWFDTGYPAKDNYRMGTETILYLVKGDKPAYFCDDHIREPYQAAQPGGGRTHNPRGKSPGNVIYMPRPAPGHASENEHISAKPEKLIERLILTSCASGGIVLDPFMGSGTTIEAAKRLGRRAIGIEIEERYCEIAARRLQQEVMPL